MNQSGDKTFVEAARSLAPLLKEAGRRMETERRLAPEVLDALHAAGLFRMLLPRAFGGAELDLRTFMEVIETLAMEDASVAWCVGQAAGCEMAGAYLDRAVVREIWSDPKRVLAWGPVLPKTGRITQVDGGYVFHGVAQFLSGMRHAQWFGARGMVTQPDGTPRPGPNGKPEGLRVLLFPSEKVKILDVWQVVGLRATASDSIEAAELFVPSEHSFVMDGFSDRREQGVLYQFTINNVFGVAFASVALGIGRSALDAFADLAGKKSPRYWAGAMRENGLVQNSFAINEAKLRSARAYLVHTVESSWSHLSAGGEQLPFEHRADIRLAVTHAIHAAKEVVDYAYQSAGATAIFAVNPFERRFRDIHAVSQSIQGSTAQFTNTGQVLLGVTPDNPNVF